MVNQQYINCPDCGSPIPFDPYALVKGQRFSCPKCLDVSIGLASESRDVVKESLDKLESLKKDLSTKNPDQPST